MAISWAAGSFFIVMFCAATALHPALLMGQARPLSLPPDFDREVSMIGRRVDGRIFHPVFYSAELAARLAANGTPEDLQIAKRVLKNVLECQERREGAAHYGAFRWFREEDTVEDLNAVDFVLYFLIPMMIQHQDRLSPDTRHAVLESIRLGLEEIRRIDVNLKYSNVALKDITNSALGGELLADSRIAQRGYRRLADWMALTDQSGGAYEYNSLPYTAMSIQYLATLANFVKHKETRIRARTMLARLALSAGLHIHPPTGRWAGPHGRAYYPSIAGEPGAYLLAPLEVQTLKSWIGEGVVPSWVKDMLERQTEPFRVVETASVADQLSASTYFSKSFALGVASRNLINNKVNRFISWESNVFTVQYTRRGESRPGSVFTRYILNNEWLGDFSPGPGRSRDYLIPDVGHFQGVQDAERAIGLYVPATLGARDRASSAKAVVAWTRWNPAADQIWINDKRISGLPANVPRDSTVVVVSGDAMIAVRPLTITDLGWNSPIRMVEKQGTLLLEMYNYLGPAKTFWEVAWPGDFYQGLPQCGFYAEVAERSAYPDGAAFAKQVAAGALNEKVDPPFTYSGEGKRLWRVEYSRGGRSLGIEADLIDWSRPSRRWTHTGELGWPMLESAIARENRTGLVQVGQATLRTGKQPAWLFASPTGRRWVAGYHGPVPSPVTLEVPGGRVEIQQMSTGVVIWDEGKVTVDAIGLTGTPKVVGGQLVSR